MIELKRLRMVGLIQQTTLKEHAEYKKSRDPKSPDLQTLKDTTGLKTDSYMSEFESSCSESDEADLDASIGREIKQLV